MSQRLLFIVGMISIIILTLISFVSDNFRLSNEVKAAFNTPRLTATLALTPIVWLPYIVRSNAPTSTYTPTRTPTATSTSTRTPSPTATDIPTKTPTATDIAETGIVIEIIEYDPPGLDAEGEYVDLRNEKFVTIDITGWTLRDESEAVFTFPSFSLAGQATVRVWVRSGVNDASNLYWRHNSATWNNDGDIAFLRDENGVLMDSCTYPGGGEFVVCSGGIWPIRP